MEGAPGADLDTSRLWVAWRAAQRFPGTQSPGQPQRRHHLVKRHADWPWSQMYAAFVSQKPFGLRDQRWPLVSAAHAGSARLRVPPGTAHGAKRDEDCEGHHWPSDEGKFAELGGQPD